MIEKATTSKLFKFDLSILLSVSATKPQLFVPIFLRLIGGKWTSDTVELAVIKYVRKFNISKVTNRNFILDKENTLKFLESNKKFALQYILIAAHRSLNTYRTTGDTGLVIEEYPELDTKSHNPLLYHENGKVMLVPEKYKFDNSMSNLR